MYPVFRITVRDEYAGTVEMVRDCRTDTAEEVGKAFEAWADFGGEEPDYLVTGQSGMWHVYVPIGGGFSHYDVSIGANGFQFEEA
jgi:hypothetical protein